MSIAGIVTQLDSIKDIVTRGLTPGEAIAEVVERNAGGYFDYSTLIERKRPKYKAKTKEEKKAKPILEDIAEQMSAGPGIDTKADLELVLRMRLRYQGIKYKQLYLKWLQVQHNEIKQEIKKEVRKRRKRKDEKAVIMLLLT